MNKVKMISLKGNGINDKAFILYDGLVSFVILTSFIMFFILLINIYQVINYNEQNRLMALGKIKDSVYEHYTSGEYLEIDTANVYSEETRGSYCVYYKVRNQRGNEEKIKTKDVAKEENYEKYCI